MLRTYISMGIVEGNSYAWNRGGVLLLVPVAEYHRPCSKFCYSERGNWRYSLRNRIALPKRCWESRDEGS